MSHMWILEHLDDVRSDMSVYHRVDEVEHLTADRFIAYAWRLPAYGGAVASVGKRQAPVPDEPTVVQDSADTGQWNDITELMRTDPLFMGQGTWSQVYAE